MAYTFAPMQSFTSGGRSTSGGGLANDPTYREQLFDRVAYVNGVETPLLNLLTREQLYNTLYSFSMGQIAYDRTTIPADVEGKQHTSLGTANSAKVRIRAYNGIHIHSRDVAVSDIQRGMREVGVPDEYQHQAWQETLGLGVDFENIMLWSRYVAGTESSFPGAPGAAPQTHGLFAWLYDTGYDAVAATIAGTTIPNYYSSTLYQGSGVDMTRRQFNDNILQPAWDKGMELDNAFWFVGTKVKRVISEYSHIYSGSGATLSASPLNYRNIPAGAHKIVDKLDIYEGDWGRVFVVKNRNMANTTPFAAFGPGGKQNNITPASCIIGFEPRYVGLGVFEGINHVPLAKLGSTSQGYVEGVLGLICRNPRALAGGYDLAA